MQIKDGSYIPTRTADQEYQQDDKVRITSKKDKARIMDGRDSATKTAKQAFQKDGEAPITSWNNKVPIEKTKRTNDVAFNIEGKVYNRNSRNSKYSPDININKGIYSDNELSNAYNERTKKNTWKQNLLSKNEWQHDTTNKDALINDTTTWTNISSPEYAEGLTKQFSNSTCYNASELTKQMFVTASHYETKMINAIEAYPVSSTFKNSNKPKLEQ